MNRFRCHWDGRECPYDSTPVCLMSRDGQTCDGEPLVRAEVGPGRSARVAVLALAACALVSSLLLAACDTRPEHAEWQMQCVESHLKTYVLPTYNAALKITMLQTYYTAVCDREEAVCVAGRDGSTECEGQPS